MKKPNKAELKRFDDFRHFGCMVCGSSMYEVHHIRHSGKRDHSKTIPLCFIHHRSHGQGVSVHDGLESWEAVHGTESELLEEINEVLV